MKERVSWIQSGTNFKRVEGNITNVETLPRGIYNVGLSHEGWFLTKTSDEFTFDYKVYGLQTEFVAHVLKAYNSTKGNFGLLLNGVKGTGKTVTAKILANRFNLPIIVAKSFGDHNTALIEYLSSFNFDCVIFFDEFEKNFNERDCSILQIMDGVYSSNYRRIFLLTTNTTSINENLLSRPSRIRYVKEFGNLEESVVREYLADNLTDKSDVESVVDFVDTLQISTIDILKTIVEDVNVFGFDGFFAHKDIFNVKTATYHYQAIWASFDSYDDYSVSQWLIDSKKIHNTPRPSRYAMTDKQFERAYEEYNKKMPRIGYSEREINSNKSFKNLRAGDHFGYYKSEVVIEVLPNDNIVVTVDTDDQSKYYYFIKNPNAKPSLYNSNAYAYGSYGDASYFNANSQNASSGENCEDCCESIA